MVGTIIKGLSVMERARQPTFEGLFKYVYTQKSTTAKINPFRVKVLFDVLCATILYWINDQTNCYINEKSFACSCIRVGNYMS